MPHPPPPSSNVLSMSAPALVGLMKAGRARQERADQPANPRVQVFPSANGTVLLVGVTLEGGWVAEYRCLADDFDERCISAMERRVRLKERGTMRVMR